MNADREAFVREIAEHLDDDAPRLIFADWLEERGDPQGQFIRLQCELERTSDRERRSILIRHETDLLREHRDEWLRPFGGALVRGVFRRGMLDQAEVESQTAVNCSIETVFAYWVLQTSVHWKNSGLAPINWGRKRFAGSHHPL